MYIYICIHISISISIYIYIYIYTYEAFWREDKQDKHQQTIEVHSSGITEHHLQT